MDILKIQQKLIEAQAEYIKALAAGNNVLYPYILPESVQNKMPSFASLAAEFMEYEKGIIRPQTYNLYSYYLQHGILEKFGDMAINEITTENLQNMVNDEVQKYSVKTVREKIMLTKSILHYAENKGLIQCCEHKI